MITFSHSVTLNSPDVAYYAMDAVDLKLHTF